jgi:hypothetical protein
VVVASLSPRSRLVASRAIKVGDVEHKSRLLGLVVVDVRCGSGGVLCGRKLHYSSTLDLKSAVSDQLKAIFSN